MNRIKELRTEKQLTLKEFSTNFNKFTKDNRDNIKSISYATVSRWEKGINEPKLEMWQALAKYFNVPVSYLQGLGMSESEFKEKLFNTIVHNPKFAKNIAGYFSGVNQDIVLNASNEITENNYQELKDSFVLSFDITPFKDKYNFFSSIDYSISDDEFQNMILDKLNNDNISVFDFSYMFPELYKRLIDIFDKMTLDDEYFILKKVGKNILFDELKKHYQERVEKESKENSISDES
ncbi:helix-turn-helix domain-containing protein [Ligilactobacillus salivarius]|uniref:helix-turn-helix domain-containing protein n=1 Tax=Ligilactobacillus salivarius TaxID=1624 RepID=UPI0024BA1701|nr:helix-turn-helix transcriptional regulator [Ligilactobacillus salivarius]